jgi:hypothetical protein
MAARSGSLASGRAKFNPQKEKPPHFCEGLQSKVAGEEVGGPSGLVDQAALGMKGFMASAIGAEVSLSQSA